MQDHSGISAELLTVRGQAQQRLHGKAAEAAIDHFGRSVFLRGVIEVSNFCRENCHYCGMRRSNRDLDRSRASLDQLSELLVNHVPAGVTDINLQAGEDPRAARGLRVRGRDNRDAATDAAAVGGGGGRDRRAEA